MNRLSTRWMGTAPLDHLTLYFLTAFTLGYGVMSSPIDEGSQEN